MLQQADEFRQKRGESAGHKNAPRLALILVGIGDLTGSGGAERIFSDLHQHFESRPKGFSVALIADRASLRSLQRSGRLLSEAGVIVLSLGKTPTRGKLRTAWTTVRLLWATLARRFDLVHVCLPTPNFVPFVALLNRVPASIRPKVVITIVDCTLAQSVDDPPSPGTYERQVLDAHLLYFRWTRLDGVFSWYRAAADTIRSRHLLRGSPLVAAAQFCFTNPTRFMPNPAKENLIVFAGRLSEQKRPLLFVDAVAALVAREPNLASGWRFEIYGKGILESKVRRRIAERGLDGIVTLAHSIDMAPVFARSRLFVSPQAVENFTSLSMLEAMAAGNAVIGAAVGQTAEFVRDGENGHLVVNDSPEGFADAIAEYIRHPERHEALATCSRQLATEVHTVEHFADDLTSFWRAVLDEPASSSA